MNAWQRLAWIEWYRSFRLTGKDNHDFFWLAVLLWLTLTLALLLWGSREGLLNKLVDVSLGNIEGVGVPIWVVANNSEGIDRQLWQQTEIQLYPYREVDQIEVKLPNSPADKQRWFEGWAVSSEDPLWQLGVKSVASAPVPQTVSVPPLAIILSKNLFKQYFNCAIYVESLRPQLPSASLPPPATKEDNLSCLANNILWLEVKVGTERQELLPFQIHWQPRIPTMHHLAFLFPLSTWYTLRVSSYFTNVRYYPEAQEVQEEKSLRIKELMVWRGEQEVKGLETLKTCLGQAEVNGDRMVLSYPLPKQWVMGCIQHSGMSFSTGLERVLPPYLTLTEESESHYFQYDNSGYLTLFCDQSHSACVPCQSVTQSPAWNGLPHTVCTEKQTTADMLELVEPYQKALVYVKNRADLANSLEKIQQLPQSGTDHRLAFYIHPTYKDALTRFLFIQKMIDMLKLVYTPLFLLFLVILLIVQVGIVITHRRHNYGILLAKGVSWLQLYQMILMQMTLSFLVAMGIAVLIIQSIRGWLSWEFVDILVQKPYIDHLLVNDFDLLPLSWLAYAAVGVITLAMSYLITTLMFKQTVVGRQVEPAYLFR
jgi:hypothetical protein